MKTRWTKKQALSNFKQHILPLVIQQYGKKDKPSQSEAWNQYTDNLCRAGEITLKQYESWSNPF